MINKKGHWAAVCLLMGVLLSAASARAATGTIQDVKHVVILMQENRSFDHFFGTMQGVRGFNDPDVLIHPWGLSAISQFSTTVTNVVLPFLTTNVCITD